MVQLIKKALKKTGLFYYFKYSKARALYEILVKPEKKKAQLKEIKFYNSFLPPCSLIFDIGANDGHKTIVFKNLATTVIACDPDPVNLAILKAQFGKNKNIAICFHPVNIDNKGTIMKDTITKKVSKITTIYDLVKGNYIHTCSAVYRNNLFEKLPDYFHKAPVGDYFLHLLNSRHGTIYCINEIMANYRIHDTSYWSSKKQAERSEIWIAFLNGIMPNFDAKIQNQLQTQIEKTKGTYKKKNVFLKIKDFLIDKFNL